MSDVAWPRLLKHRSDLRFSFNEVSLAIADDGVIVVSDPKNHRGFCPTARAVKNSERGSFIGSIEALRLRDLRTTVVSILSPRGLVAVLDCESGQWNLPQLGEHLDDLPSAIAIEGSMYALRKWQDMLME